MPTDTNGDHPRDRTGSQTVAQKLSATSERIQGRVGSITPENTAKFKQGFKVAFSLALTVVFVYWVMAYQFDVVWFEF